MQESLSELEACLGSSFEIVLKYLGLSWFSISKGVQQVTQVYKV